MDVQAEQELGVLSGFPPSSVGVFSHTLPPLLALFYATDVGRTEIG